MKDSAPSNSKFVITVATDGSCKGNPGAGGWGALIRFSDGSVEEFGGYEHETTNNRMELKAALEVLKRLKALKREKGLTIRTDSKYLIDGLTKWIIGWKRKNWKTASGKNVLNRDLWEALDQANLDDVSLEYVKGHSGDPDNDRVDKIAVSYSQGNRAHITSEQSNNRRQASSESSAQSIVVQTNFDQNSLQALVTNLEIANHLAKTGYGLNLDELSKLVGEPVNKLKQRQSSWQWRNWMVEPIGENFWRLRIITEQSSNSKPAND